MRDSAVLQVESDVLHEGQDGDGAEDSLELHTSLELNELQGPQKLQESQTSDEARSAPQAQGKFVIRLPPGLLKKLSKISRQHQRSMNSEINLLLGRYLEEQGLLDSDPGDEEPESLDSRLRRKLNSMPAEKREALLHLLE